jgi:hypothetical protein
VAGDEGVTLFEVMMGDPRGWGDDPESFEATLAAHGATALADPAVDLPEWLEDLRDRWLPAAESPRATDAGHPGPPSGADPGPAG